MSSFGERFRVTTFGESHCKGVGCIVDGVPPRMRLTEADIQIQLSRRKPGQSHLTTQRNEADAVTIQSGTEAGYTLGTPISLFVVNLDHRPGDYKETADVPRPSHADFTYQAKYGVRASSGGGRASARETIGRVAAGAIAEKWLSERFGVQIVAWVSRVQNVTCPVEWETNGALSRAMVDQQLVRCPPDEQLATEMTRVIETAKANQDSVGGVVTCVCRNVPLGIGEPCFDKLEAMLAHAMLSIPATKGFEIGSGFDGTRLTGSQHNDMFEAKSNLHARNTPAADASTTVLGTKTNRSGGIQGGITNGENVVFRVAFKPPATIGQVQQNTVSFDGETAALSVGGRHDPCVLPRALPIVEAMAALVLADACMIQLARQSAASEYPVMGRVARPSSSSSAAAAGASDVAKNDDRDTQGSGKRARLQQ